MSQIPEVEADHPSGRIGAGDCPVARRRFHLIHGTWSRNAAWTLPGSEFRAHIKKKLRARDEEFCRLEWWGLNQVSSRDNAACTLRRKVLETPDDVQHYLIAHSHGGNVALYAIRDAAVRRRVKGIVCMSTPFLHVEDRCLGNWLSVLCAAYCVIYCSILGWVIYHVCRELSPPHHFASYVFDFALILGLLILAAAAFLLFSAAIGPFVLGKWVTRKLQLARVATEEILIVRAVGDEASAALATARFVDWAVSIFLRIPSMLHHAAAAPIAVLQQRRAATIARFGRFLLRATIILVPAVFVSLVIAAITRSSSTLVSEVFFGLACAAFACWIVLLVVFLAVVYRYSSTKGAAVSAWLITAVIQATFAAIAPVLVVLLAFSAGVELAIVTFRVRLSAEATPQGCASVHMFPVLPPPNGDDPPVFGSHCGIYDNKDVQEMVAEWLLEKCSSRGEGGQSADAGEPADTRQLHV